MRLKLYAMTGNVCEYENYEMTIVLILKLIKPTTGKWSAVEESGMAGLKWCLRKIDTSLYNKYHKMVLFYLLMCLEY